MAGCVFEGLFQVRPLPTQLISQMKSRPQTDMRGTADRSISSRQHDYEFTGSFKELAAFFNIWGLGRASLLTDGKITTTFTSMMGADPFTASLMMNMK